MKTTSATRRAGFAHLQQLCETPTVARQLPGSVRTIIGNLSDTERVLVGLDLRTAI